MLNRTLVTLVIKIGDLEDDFDDVLNAWEEGQPATAITDYSYPMPSSWA